MNKEEIYHKRTDTITLSEALDMEGEKKKVILIK